MEYFDTFNDDGVFISSEDEVDVHYKGLWHKVIRIWIYDNEGNVWLRKNKSTKKLDAINEIHLISNESVANGFDRAMFDKLGIHLSSSSTISLVGTKKMSFIKNFTDGSQLKENYFLCDYIADYNDAVKFFIFDDETESIVKCNAQGVVNLLSSKVENVIANEYKEDALHNIEKIILSFNDIERSATENNNQKFITVLNVIIEKLKELEKEKIGNSNSSIFEDDDKNNNESHADENEGSDIY